ncbi:MAG: low specificity L-threonine aldolase [Lachnospiraceae bacterium]|nr:low specificity L-threonine aldolase [Lachnospiraceae bacterium]
MIRFNCDYSEGAHPRILERLIETNMEQTPGYGEDEYCRVAAQIVKKLCGREDCDVHFMIGGTQTNLTVISAALRPHQCVIAAKSGHIAIHETGAIEATGHKVMELEGHNGKICAEQVKTICQRHWMDESHEHIAQPKLVYISNPTELGTIYSKAELLELRAVCDEYELYLFMDGARLGYGLVAQDNDLDLPTIATLCDVFYIGGTKLGAFFGEALVIGNIQLQKDFRYIIKQKGGMLAKGRLLGIQFEELLGTGLYFDIAKHAVEMAMLIKEGLQKAGIPLYIDSSTNQQFVIMPNVKLEQWKNKYTYSMEHAYDEKHTVVRLCTSWATKQEDVLKLVEDMK